MMDDYNLPIGADISGLLNNINQVKTGLQQVNDAAASTSKTIQAGFDGAAKSADNANKVIAQAATAYNTANNSLAELTDALIEYKNLAFTEKDIDKLKTYNANIRAIEDEMQLLSNIGKKTFAEQTGQINNLNRQLEIYKTALSRATDTADIVKYNQKIQETQNSLTKLGNAGKAGFDAVGNKIKETEGLIEKLNADIKLFQNDLGKATDPAQVARLNKQLEQTQNDLKAVQNAGKAGFDDLGNKIEDTTKKGNGFLSGLKNIAGAFGFVVGIQTLVSLGKELFNVAVQASGIERAFTSLGRPDFLPKLRQETQGFISDLDLEKLTVKANNFNIPVDRLGKLLLFASQRAKDTGEDVNALTENIIDGLGRKSTRIIDNLGISAIEVQKEFKKTGDFTIAVSNIIEREMGKSGVAVDTLADKVTRGNAKISNFFKSIANGLFGDLVSDDNINALTAKALKAQTNFTKLTDDQRKQSIADQIAQVNKLSEAYKKVTTTPLNYSLFGIGGNSYKAAKDIQDAQTKSIGEQLVASQNVLKILQKQNSERENADRLEKGLTSDTEKLAKIQELRGQVANFVVGITGTQEEKDALRKQADDLQKIVDESSASAEKKAEAAREKAQKARDAAAKKRLERAKQVANEELTLQNQITQDLAQNETDKTELQVSQENARFVNTLRTLGKAAKDFPELQGLVNKAIEAENTAHFNRLAVITKKGEDEQAKILSDGQKAIASVLKTDNDAQVDAVNQRYTDIRDKAKKAGLLTADVEKKLAEQQAKDVSDIVIKTQNDLITKQEELAISGVQARKKKEGESEQAYERDNQIKILEIQKQFKQQQLDNIDNAIFDGTATDEQVKSANQLQAAINGIDESLTHLYQNKKDDLFSALGLDPNKIQYYAEAVSTVGQQLSSLFSALDEGAKQRVDNINKQIDAIDDLISTDQSAVDTQQDLANKGVANDLSAAQAKLQVDKDQKAALQKQAEDAQKKENQLQKEQLIADAAAQASSLITASAEIFKSLASIPFVGVPLAIALIGTMFGAFAISKVNAIKAVGSDSTTKFKKGGKLAGKSHEDGGNKYRSMDGNDQNTIELEKNEYVVNAASTAKHEKLIDAINRDDFSGLKLSDYSIKELLQGTGVAHHSDVARSLGAEITDKQDKSSSPVIIVTQNNDPNSAKIESHLETLVKIQLSKPDVIDYGDHIEITYKNQQGRTIKIERAWKKK